MRVIIRIRNWEIYNPRTDLKTMTWFRLQANIAIGPTLFGMPVDAKWLWVSVMSLCAQKNNESITLPLSYLAHVSGVKEEMIIDYLRDFSSPERDLIELIDDQNFITNESVRITNESDRARNVKRANPNENGPYETRRDETERDEHNEHNKQGGVKTATDISFYLLHELSSRKVSLKTQEKWKKEYKEEFIEAEFRKYQDWSNGKNIRNFESVFGRWLSDNHQSSQLKKITPEIDANAKSWARYAHAEILKNSNWIGDTEFDASVFLNIDKEISSEKTIALNQLKTAWIKTYMEVE